MCDVNKINENMKIIIINKMWLWLYIQHKHI